MRQALAIASALMISTAAQASPWQDVAHPYRRRCSQLAGEAVKLDEQHQTKAATQAARAAAALCPSDRAVLQSAGEVLLDAREYSEARQRLERARTLSANAPETRERELSLAFLIGFAREVTGDLDGAIEEHRRLEAMGGLPSPNQFLVHYDLGDELMAAGRLTEAIEEYRRALLLAPPTKPIVRLALAVALDRDGQVDQARAELVAVLAFDHELRSLGSDEYVFVPREDVYYYRALALYERGATAEARLNLRAFLAELPSSPYAARARERLADAEQHIDPRELDPASLGVERQILARALGPLVSALEGCLPGQKLLRVRLVIASGHATVEFQHPAAECLDRVLSQIDAPTLGMLPPLSASVPLAGRRGAASLP